METITFDVSGMTCMGCVASVKRVLTPLPGVSQVDVVLETGKVSVSYAADQSQPAQFKQAIQDAGYQVA